MAIYLGIDGGGTKTTCAIGDDSSLLGTGTAGGSNVIRVGEAQAREAIHAAIRQACTVANVPPSQVQRVCIGVAGAAREDISEQIRRMVSEVMGGSIEVVGDMVIALQAAFGRGPGVITVGGTGSIAYGRDEKGHTARAGGWGYAVSDEGSGHWIGRSAVAASLRARDEGQDTQLLDQILRAWHLQHVDGLVVTANHIPPPDFAGLLPVVLSASDAGDALARTILTQAGAELALLAKIVVNRLFSEESAVPVAMSGGVFRNSALVRQVFYNSLRAEYPNAAVNASVIEPVRGALELARKGR